MHLAQHSLKSGESPADPAGGDSIPVARALRNHLRPVLLRCHYQYSVTARLDSFTFCAFRFVYVLCFSRRCWLHLPLFSRGGRPPPPRSGAFGGARLPRLRLLLGDWARCEPLRADVSLRHVMTSPPVAVGSPVGPWRVICCHGLDRAPLNSYGGAPVPRPQTEAAVGDETFPG